MAALFRKSPESERLFFLYTEIFEAVGVRLIGDLYDILGGEQETLDPFPLLSLQ